MTYDHDPFFNIGLCLRCEVCGNELKSNPSAGLKPNGELVTEDCVFSKLEF